MTSREIIFMTFAIKERRRLGEDLSPEVLLIEILVEWLMKVEIVNHWWIWDCFGWAFVELFLFKVFLSKFWLMQPFRRKMRAKLQKLENQILKVNRNEVAEKFWRFVLCKASHRFMSQRKRIAGSWKLKVETFRSFSSPSPLNDVLFDFIASFAATSSEFQQYSIQKRSLMLLLWNEYVVWCKFQPSCRMSTSIPLSAIKILTISFKQWLEIETKLNNKLTEQNSFVANISIIPQL
jgi:hypothetical protein